MENCRCCLKITENPIRLINEYHKKFYLITGVEINELNDGYLCKTCYEQLLLAWKFREEVVKANDWFVQQSKIPKVESEEFEVKNEVDCEIFIEDSPIIETSKSEENILETNGEDKVKSRTKGPYICFFCEAEFRLYLEILAHLKIHKRERGLTCLRCGAKFLNKKKRYTHEKIHKRKENQSSTFVCEYCAKSFLSARQLGVHSRCHSSVRKYKCTIEACSEAFSAKRAFYSHLNTSHGIKQPCVCHKCGTSYVNHLTLRSHEREQHPEDESKMLSCPECPDKKFINKSKLERHIVKHRNIRNFSCIFCSKKYLYTNSLRRHYRDSHNDYYLEMVRKGVFRKSIKD